MKLLIAITMMFLIVSCSAENDQNLERKIENLENRLTELEKKHNNLSLQVGRNSDSLLWD